MYRLACGGDRSYYLVIGILVCVSFVLVNDLTFNFFGGTNETNYMVMSAQEFYNDHFAQKVVVDLDMQTKNAYTNTEIYQHPPTKE